ncbi:amidohydrolase family protein [Pararobbsia alpina]|uniref:8-oxoguanine deaminase n=1 Tax=Pararobbsia alpina TaxID=621374 RepID=A0A6S7BBL5_9BURK|nr:amidohydrolase family protein [Pararobbsia alpina]CAB3793911.1 8-oxoguanine deaminase [Pararobbsia alpina]
MDTHRNTSNDSAGPFAAGRPILIRQAHIVSMDDSIGDLTGDVLVKDGKIVEVAPSIEAGQATVIDGRHKVLIPGFVNTHIHLWQTVMKGCAGDWTFNDYLQHALGSAGKQFTAQDVYLSTFLGALEQMEAGVTTVFDWAHILNTPEHTDRAIDGLQDSGIRAVFGHGTPGDDVGKWYYQSTTPHLDDVVRIRKSRLSSDDDLVTLGLSMRGPDFATAEVTRADIELARSLGIMSSMHVAVGMYGDYTANVRALGKAGLLGPDINLTHGNRLADDEIAMAVDAGVSISVTPEVEMQMGHGLPITGRVLGAGGNIVLGTDVVSSVSADMFSQMRFAVQLERGLANSRLHEEGRMPERFTLNARDVLRSATIHGARALGLANRTGSVTPGKEADLTLLGWDQAHVQPRVDPVQAVVFHGSVTNVHTVMVRGQVQKFEYQSLNRPEQTLRDAEAAGARILEALALPKSAVI